MFEAHNGHDALPAPQLAEFSFANFSGLRLFSDEPLFKATGVRIAFTERHGGFSKAPFASLNLSDRFGDALETVESNQRVLLSCFDCGHCQEQLIQPVQVHGDTIIEVQDVASARECASQGADGVICSHLHVPVLLCFADCVPVIIVAPSACFAVLHAGWRGALAGIVAKGLKHIGDCAGCRPDECNIYIGAHIGPCCFEVGEDVRDRFVAEYGKQVCADANHLDLSKVVIAQVLQAGAVRERICEIGQCTACNTQDWFSYRAEDGKTGRHGAFAIRIGEPR